MLSERWWILVCLGTEGHTLIDFHLNSHRSNYSSTRQMETLITGRFISLLREVHPVAYLSY